MCTRFPENTMKCWIKYDKHPYKSMPCLKESKENPEDAQWSENQKLERKTCSEVTALRIFAEFNCLKVCILTVWKNIQETNPWTRNEPLYKIRTIQCLCFRERGKKIHLTTKENDKEQDPYGEKNATDKSSLQKSPHACRKLQNETCSPETEVVEWYIY